MNQKTSKVASSCGMIGVTERGTRQSSLNMHYLLFNYIIQTFMLSVGFFICNTSSK